MTSYTPSLLLNVPTPFDPAVANIWGTIWNTNANLLDASIAGLLSKSVAGSSNVVLTNNQGAPDEARYAMFNFTGTLTGSIYVLWPKNQSARFTVTNNTTGAFSLSLGVNNGSGSPEGDTVTLAQGATGLFQSDGTDVIASVNVTPAIIGALAVAANLSDVADVPTSRSNLGIGSMATRNVFIQNGGSPSGGANGDIFLIY